MLVIESTKSPSRETHSLAGLWQLYLVFAGQALMSHVLAALVSGLVPLTHIESGIALWPPVRPWSAWLSRIWLEPFNRWDVDSYVRIVSLGYHIDDGTAAFHPLYPALARLLFELGTSPLFALIFVRTIAATVTVFVLYRLVRRDQNEETTKTALALFLVSPLSLAIMLPYPEALFMALAGMCLYWLGGHRWVLAGLAGGLACLTRQQGILLVVPYLVEIWEVSRSCEFWKCRKGLGAAMGIGLIPAGYLLWILYRALVLGDVNPNLSNLQTLIYSILISPSAVQVVGSQRFVWPWGAMWFGLLKLATDPDIDIIVNAVLVLGFSVALLRRWRGMSSRDRGYALAVVLVSLSFHTGTQHPYMGLPRHLALALPAMMSADLPAYSKGAKMGLFASNAFLRSAVLIMYQLHVWVP